MRPISKSTHLFLVFILTLLSSQSVIAQCPLDIGETTVAPTQDLTLYFPFDGNVNNLGNPAYSAILSGANFVNTDCGQGLEFDGVDDYVKVTPSLWLDNDFTVAMWVERHAGGNGFFFVNRDQCVTTYRGWSQASFSVISNNRLYDGVNKNLNCTNWSNGMRYRTVQDSVFPDDTRVFVALTVENNDANSRVVHFFLNCSEFSTDLYMNLPTTGSNMSTIFNAAARNYETMIGATSTVNNSYGNFIRSLDGVIDDFRLYESVLNPQQIDSVYRSCLPITTTMERFSDCETDSAEIRLAHSQLDVNYQLYDITNGVFINPVVPGNCDTLVFNTPLVTDTNQYQIVATHNTSGCALNMDSIFTIHPESHTFYDTTHVTICSGDSVLFNGNYLHNSGFYADTVQFTPFCDSIVGITIVELSNGLANFVRTDTIGCYPINVSFTSTSNIPASMVIDSWSWDFGDGGTSTLENPVHTYTTGGTYDVTLTITTVNGCVFDTVITTVYPDVYYTYGQEAITICYGDSIQVNNTYVYNSGVYSDTISLAPLCDSVVTITLVELPNGFANFVRTDTTGCYPIDVSFTSTSNIPAPMVIDNWSWDFGDGGTSTLENPVHTYTAGGTYDVTLTITTVNGCVFDTVITTVYPDVYYTYGQEVITMCYGDSILVNNAYVYNSGVYSDTISLTPLCDSIVTITLTEFPNLILDFSVEDTVSCLSSNTQFTDLSQASAFDVSTVWNFGDGIESSLPNPTHSYATSGLYLVTLTKTTANGCVFSISRWVEIIIYPQPHADFTFAPAQPMVGEPVQFIDESINATNWVWDFGDASGSIDQNPAHSFDPLGNYTVLLTVSNGICFDSTSVILAVEEGVVFFIPNAFTPDGDEMNNTFQPVFTSGYDPNDFHLTIYDRWGEVVFESYDVAHGWDGTYRNNSIAQDGIYTWKVEFGDVNDDERYIHTGYVTLIR